MSSAVGTIFGALALLALGIVLELSFGREIACRVMFSIWGLLIAVFFGSLFTGLSDIWIERRRSRSRHKVVEET